MDSPLIDLRSDTVTRPTRAMRDAMAAAEVGDDVFGEDPTVRRLQDSVAALLGKADALFVPSGTMANQIALMLHTERGDEVIVGEGAHCMFYETGAGAALGGVQFAVAGRGGLFGSADVDACAKPPADWHPRTRVVAIENTHNRAGGRVFPLSDIAAIAGRARALGLGMHLDGARLWNAAIATGTPLAELAEPFETVSVCLSKGLGAPVGSLIVTSAERAARARRLRKMLGGGMRQVGVLAAAGLFALEHHRARLADDHANARRFHAIVDESLGGSLAPPETNIVMIDLPIGRDAVEFAGLAKSRGVLLAPFGPTRLRAVTHLDVSAGDAELAGRTVASLLRAR